MPISSMATHDLSPAGQFRTKDVTSLALEPAHNLVWGECTSDLGESGFYSGVGTWRKERDSQEMIERLAPISAVTQIRRRWTYGTKEFDRPAGLTDPY